MYLFIPEKILQTKQLNSDEKIVLSFIASLNRQGRGFFGTAEWLDAKFGLQNSAVILAALAVEVRRENGKSVRPRYIEYVLGRWQLVPEVYSILFGGSNGPESKNC